MTRAEKVAQLGSVWPAQLSDGETFDAAPCACVRRSTASARSRASPAPPCWTPKAATRLGNDIQRWLREETRLGIPAILHEESLHGLTALGSVVHPQSINMAATWRPGLVEEMAGYIGRAAARPRRHARALAHLRHHPRSALGPHRGDLRRGHLPRDGASAVPTPAACRREGVLACGKHLVGHGLPEGGYEPRPDAHRAARAARALPAALRGRRPTGAAGHDDARLRRDRRPALRLLA